MDSSGQLGDGAGAQQLVPVAATGLGSGVESVSASYGSTFATLTDHSFRSFGSNTSSELGIAAPDRVKVPIAAQGFASSVASISLGWQASCAVLTDGTVQCWGWGADGALGDSNWVTSSTPVTAGTGATMVTASYDFACAVSSAGAAYCWGNNDYGNLGIGTYDYEGEPTQVMGLTSGVTAINASEEANRVCAIVSGGLKCWGAANGVDLGDGTGNDQLSPVGVTGMSSGVTAVAVGTDQICAIKSGAVYCWGVGGNGAIGDGTTADHATPVQVIASGATAIAAGDYETCAIVSGAAKCWGANWNCQLGTGDCTDHLSPTQVTGLTSGVTAIGVSDSHGCALLSTGAVKCWGANNYGEVGDGTNTSQASPVSVVTLSSGASAIAVGHYSTCAIVSGDVRCWGGDQAGVLVDGVTLTQNTAVTPILAGSPAKLSLSAPASVSAGTCSAAFTVTLQDSAGNAVNAPTGGVTVNLSQIGSGSFYSSAGCGSGAVTSVTMAAGSSTKNFYYKASSAQQAAIVVGATRLSRDGVGYTVN
jgi:alpha-tubulin suppressor-like RCC1 family protein